MCGLAVMLTIQTLNIRGARAPKPDKTPNTAAFRCCRRCPRCHRCVLFCKIKVRPRSCRSYPLWRPWTFVEYWWDWQIAKNTSSNHIYDKNKPKETPVNREELPNVNTRFYSKHVFPGSNFTKPNYFVSRWKPKNCNGKKREPTKSCPTI